MLLGFRLVFFLITCLFIYSPLWSAPRVFQVDQELEEQKIGPFSEYFLDRSNALTLEQVQEIPGRNWHPVLKESLVLENIRSWVWLRFHLKNTEKRSLHLFLQEAYPVMDQVSYYIPESDGRFRHWKLGGRVSFAERFIPHRSFVVPILLPPDKTLTVYVRLKGRGRNIVDPGIYSEAGLLRNFLSQDHFLWLYVGFLLIMFAYNSLLFMTTRNPAYFYYIVFVFLLLISRGLVNGLGYIFDAPGLTEAARGLKNFSILAAGAAMFQFFRVYISIKKYSLLLDRLVLVLTVILLGVALVYPFQSWAWFGTSVLYFIICASLFLSYVMVYLILKKSREAIFTGVAFAFFLAGVMVLSLKTLGFFTPGFFVLNSMRIGSAIQIVLLSLALADTINLSRARTIRSEAGYRHLMLNSRNIIFTLDEDFQFLAVNPVVKEYLGLSESEVIGTTFVDLIYPEERFSNMGTREFFKESFNVLVQSGSGEPLRFYIHSKARPEPIPMRLRLEYTRGEEDRQILGELWPITEDLLKERVLEEKQSYIIDNSINNVEILSHRLTSILPRFLPSEDVFSLRMCLREALHNAIEHGNLELEFSQKTEAMQQGVYFDVLKRLQHDSHFSDRKVQVEYLLENDRVSYRISDEGQGFNVEAMLEEMEMRARNEMNPNGRGLLMIGSEFDLVEFNEKGNSIYLVRFFERRGEFAERT